PDLSALVTAQPQRLRLTSVRLAFHDGGSQCAGHLHRLSPGTRYQPGPAYGLCSGAAIRAASGACRSRGLGVGRHRAVTGGAVRAGIPLLSEGKRVRRPGAPVAGPVTVALRAGAA